ncbi:sulfotransferase family protein [Roseovarius sp. 2305UL8-3]|uniref:sulfotransferase family protein n=1 Tax=Roseovarius conchicola TaxID=3121636 RepID=UPI003529BE00
MTSTAPTFVFVVGCQRSGTTLTGQILGAHPKAVLLDEPDGIYPWFEALDPDKPLARPPLSKVLEKAAAKYADPDQRFQHLPNGLLWFAPGVTHIILKAPNLTYHGPQIEQMHARKKIVSLMRDPRDVVASMQNLSQIQMVRNQLSLMEQKPDLPDWIKPEMARLRDETLPINHKRAIVWAIKTRLCQELPQMTPGNLRIIYEELVAKPDEIMPVLCNHVQFEDHENLRQHEKVFVGTGPGETSRTRSIDTASLGKSKEGLTEEERKTVLSLAGPLAARYQRPAPINILSAKPPLVLLGRGGSGTRLLSEVFKDAGVFLGNKLNYSSDSMEWVETIYGGVSDKLASAQDPEELSVPHLKYKMRETAQRILERSDFEDVGAVNWGWKLPETMILVPEVLEAFPDAKVVHIVRHPVTSSLRRTHKTSRADDQIGQFVLSVARKRITIPLQHSLDDDTLNNVLSWHLQVGSVTRFCREMLPASQYLEIRYEDLFNSWESIRNKLAAFSGMPVDRLAQPTLDTTRRQSFDLPDKRIADVWRMTKDVATLHDYGLDASGAPCEFPKT